MATLKTIDPAELKDWLAQGRPVHLLDVRPDDERGEWMIPGSIHYNAYERLKAGDRLAMDALDLAVDLPVVTICARGKMSLFAAEILTEKGYEAYSLQGGMKDWNYVWDHAELQLADVKIIQVRRVAKGCLSYLIGSGDQAMVIDASLDPSVYAVLAKVQGWSIVYVADTHIHADYVSRTRDLAGYTGAHHLMMQSAEVDFPFKPLTDGEEIALGNIRITAMHTPGHTWESTSFTIGQAVAFTGDTLFTDGIGRPDLKADQAETTRKAAALYDSLQLLTAMPGETHVLPAHVSSPVVIGQAFISARIDELRHAVAGLTSGKDQFIKSLLAKVPAPPSNYLKIAEINKSGNYHGYELAELETGANRCAVR